MLFFEALERGSPFLFVEIGEFGRPHDLEAISRVRGEDAGVGPFVNEDHCRSDPEKRNVDVPTRERLDNTGARVEPLY